MNPEIVWWSQAFDRMSEIVRAAPNRKAEFATALRDLSAALTSDAEGTGESRNPPYRVVFFGEFTFYFRPAPEEGRVYVVWVRIWKARH
jgi:hypothetical protein